MATGRVDGEITGLSGNLVSRLILESVGEDRFVGRAPAVPARIYGGELAAQALAAANATVTEDRVPHLLQCTYLAPGNPDLPLSHSVTRIRDGRSFSSRAVQVHGDERLLLTATVGYHVPESGFTHQLTMPPVPAPTDLPTIADADGTAWTWWAEQDSDVELRVVPPDLADPLGRRRFWCRVVADGSADPRLHSALATYVSDFTMVASIRLPHEPPEEKLHLMSTLSHSLYFHRPFIAGDWHLVDHHSPVAAGGRGLALSHMYGQNGELVMTAVQEGLVRPLPKNHR